MNVIKDPALQPQHKDATDCLFKPLLEDNNKWQLVELKEKVRTDRDEDDILEMSGLRPALIIFSSHTFSALL